MSLQERLENNEEPGWGDNYVPPEIRAEQFYKNVSDLDLECPMECIND